jgi:hypothetical protein
MVGVKVIALAILTLESLGQRGSPVLGTVDCFEV